MLQDDVVRSSSSYLWTKKAPKAAPHSQYHATTDASDRQHSISTIPVMCPPPGFNRRRCLWPPYSISSPIHAHTLSSTKFLAIGDNWFFGEFWTFAKNQLSPKKWWEARWSPDDGGASHNNDGGASHNTLLLIIPNTMPTAFAVFFFSARRRLVCVKSRSIFVWTKNTEWTTSWTINIEI